MAVVKVVVVREGVMARCQTMVRAQQLIEIGDVKLELQLGDVFDLCVALEVEEVGEVVEHDHAGTDTHMLALLTRSWHFDLRERLAGVGGVDIGDDGLNSIFILFDEGRSSDSVSLSRK